jgi:hypothetical protein
MASQYQHRSRDAQGRRVIHEGLEPHTVFGGFKIATAEWTRTEDGWDCDYEVVSPVLYPTKEACEAGIEALRADAYPFIADEQVAA